MTSIAEQVVFRMDLPWDQLETLESRAHRDWGYHGLLESSGRPQVRTLNTASKITLLPSSISVTLHHLFQLHLHFGSRIGGTAYLDHLDTLTLPVLEDLKIRGRFGTSDPLYPIVIVLVWRSGRNLRALDECVKANVEDLGELSFLCPNLGRLDMRFWNEWGA